MPQLRIPPRFARSKKCTVHIEQLRSDTRNQGLLIEVEVGQASDQATTTTGSGAGSKDGQVPLRAPSAGPISFWVTSLPPAPVSDDASRNRWIQTHNQYSTGTTSHQHYRPPHQPPGHDLVGGGLCHAIPEGVFGP